MNWNSFNCLAESPESFRNDDALMDFRANGIDTEMNSFDHWLLESKVENLGPISRSSHRNGNSELQLLKESISNDSGLGFDLMDLAISSRTSSFSSNASDCDLTREVQEVLSSNYQTASQTERSGKCSAGKENTAATQNTFEYCVFCLNNGEEPEFYTTHKVKNEAGLVICPKLFNYKCPICGISGKKAHTVKYCPDKRIITMEDTFNRKKKIRF